MVEARQHAASPAEPLGEFQPAPQVVATRVGDTMVLLDRRTGRYYALNETGAMIWELLEAGAAFAEIVRRISEEFEAPPETLLTDTGMMLERLLALRLVELRVR